MPTSNEIILLVGLVISMGYIIWQHILIEIYKKQLESESTVEWKELKEDYR